MSACAGCREALGPDALLSMKSGTPVCRACFDAEALAETETRAQPALLASGRFAEVDFRVADPASRTLRRCASCRGVAQVDSVTYTYEKGQFTECAGIIGRTYHYACRACPARFDVSPLGESLGAIAGGLAFFATGVFLALRPGGWDRVFGLVALLGVHLLRKPVRELLAAMRCPKIVEHGTDVTTSAVVKTSSGPSQ